MATTNAIIKARARIFPSVAQQSAINNISRSIGAKIEIKWDGINWTDESTYFMTGKGDWKMEGSLGTGLASQADFELVNTTGRFLPENSDSPIYAYLSPRKQARFYVIIESTEYLMFTGYIKAIEPDRKKGKVNLHCFDNAEIVLNKKCPRSAYSDKRTDQLVEILGETAGISSADMDLETSTHIVKGAYFGDSNIWPAMGQLASAERGRVFFDINGKLKFWGRDHIQEQSRVTTLSRATHLLNLEFSVEEQNIKNRVTVKARPRAAAGIQAVWTNGDAEYLDQYTDTLVWIPAGGAQYAYIEIEDSYGPLPCTDWQTPIANTDYTANSVSDGSGTDYTSSITINTFTTYADAAYLEVQNHAPVSIYFTKFQVRASPLKIWKWISVRHEDEYSVSEYGAQPIDIENDFIDDEQMANDIAEIELARWKEAKNLFRAPILGIPYLQVGDIAGIELTNGNYKDYMINAINWTVDNNGFVEQLEFVNVIDFPVTQTVEPRADIKKAQTRTVTCKANLGTATKTIYTRARVTEFTPYTVSTTCKANISGNKELTAKSNIKATVIKTLTCEGNIT